LLVAILLVLVIAPLVLLVVLAETLEVVEVFEGGHGDVWCLLQEERVVLGVEVVNESEERNLVRDVT
jgi:hypothetical protein